MFVNGGRGFLLKLGVISPPQLFGAGGRSFLLTAVMILAGCGTEEVPNETLNLVCGKEPCGNIYTKDLLRRDAATIDSLREYVLNKKVSKPTPFKRENDGRGDINDLMRGLEIVQQLHGVNPIFALALSIHESGWGRNSQGRIKHNLWGWNSGYCTADGCGDSFDKATGFGSYSNGFNTVFRSIRRNYLTERDPASGKSGRYYYRCGDGKHVSCVDNDTKDAKACGISLAGMNCRYAADDKWANKIRAHMNNITAYVSERDDYEPISCGSTEE